RGAAHTMPRQGAAPMRSSDAPGGRPGQRGRDGRQDAESKKDRANELLLEKQRARKGGRLDGHTQPAAAKLESIEIPDVLTVQELATSMIMPPADVIKE